MVRDKLKVEQASIEIQKQELVERERQQAEQNLTLQAMFDVRDPVARADNTPDHAQAVRRLFELHLMPQTGTRRVSEVTAGDVRRAVRALLDAGKVSTAIALHMYAGAMPSWAGKRRPWRLLFDVGPVEEIDIDRPLPVGYQNWSERVLADDEIVELRNRFQFVRHAFEFRTGPRRGLATPIPREHALAVWITLGALVRVNEIYAARWREHIDFAKAAWFIPHR